MLACKVTDFSKAICSSEMRQVFYQSALITSQKTHISRSTAVRISYLVYLSTSYLIIRRCIAWDTGTACHKLRRNIQEPVLVSCLWNEGWGWQWYAARRIKRNRNEGLFGKPEWLGDYVVWIWLFNKWLWKYVMVLYNIVCFCYR